MARNRKNQAAAFRLGALLKAGLLCAAIVVSGVGYVWQKQQINVLGDQVRTREARLRELRDQNDKLKKQLAVLTSFDSLNGRVRDLKLGLGPPKPTQIWWLPEPAAEATAATAPTGPAQYASGPAPAHGP